MKIQVRWKDLLAIYQSELLENVIPFWVANAIDEEYGGLFTCITDKGEILSENKYMWSQLRALWVFSALFNRIEKRQEWLDIAVGIYEFVKKNGRDKKGHWVYCTSRDGKTIQGADSIYTDGFAIYGLTEFARATGDEQAVNLALDTFQNVQDRLSSLGSYCTEPWPTPEGFKTHGVSMVFSLVFGELGQLTGNQEIVDASLFHAHQIMDVFLRPQKKLLFEYVKEDNSLSNTPHGRAILPGHAIESMWFLIHIFQREGDNERIQKAVEAIKWHLEFGWDNEFGGLFHACDADGKTPWWPYADAKLWWPHTEALYALLLAYEIAHEQWCLDWYERVHNYTFTHFPVPKYGEWIQKLDRTGKPLTDTVALPVKDPFHMPRALLYCIQVLDRFVNENADDR
ncbi:MAG: AGE family epimerase/isomerase [Anaerolineales bacterium]|nr:AGE family epimerase/isomerase [Anaerolineales bacterium]